MFLVDVEPALVRAVQRGEPGAMDELIRGTYTDVYALCRRLLGDPADAADATQEVYLRVVRSVLAFRGESAFGTWLHRRAVNVVLARRAELGTRRRRFHDDDAPLDLVSARGTSPGALMDFEQALARLPDGARQVFVLHDVEGYRHEEIAEMLGLAAGTSKSQLHRARMALRTHMER
jgi:RNA polymerase sigma-70 factor (ECF subfamily)